MGPLALLEALDRDGMVRQAWRIDRWPVTIGRALDNDVVLTEPHVAPQHATIDLVPAPEGAAAASLLVTAGATNNGLRVGRERVAGGAAATFADSGRDLDLHIGRTRCACACRPRPGARADARAHALARDRMAADRGWPRRAGLHPLQHTSTTTPDGLGREIGKAVSVR